MSLKFIILGCGSSMGVPRADGDFGFCDPKIKRNESLKSKRNDGMDPKIKQHEGMDPRVKRMKVQIITSNK